MPGFEMIGDAFQKLTEPSPLIDSHDSQRQARLVAGSTLGLMLLTAPLFLLRYLVDSNLVFLALNTSFEIGLFILYRLSRSIYYQFTAAALIVFIYVSLTVGILAAMDARWSLVFASGNIGLGLVLIRIALPDLAFSIYLLMLLFNLLVTLYVLGFALLRQHEHQQSLEMERRYRRLFEALADPVCVHQNGLITEVNAAFERLTGLKAEDITGKALTQFVVHISPDSSAPVPGLSSASFETRIMHRDGSLIPVEIISKSHMNQGQWVQVMSVRDLRPQLKAKAALDAERNLLRALIDTVPDQLFVKDTEHRFLLANLPVYQVWKDRDLIGQTDDERHSPEQVIAFREEERRVMETGEAIKEQEINYSNVDGESRWVSSSKLPLRDPAGKIIGLVGTNRDITERKRFEDHLRYHADLIDDIADAVISTNLDHCIVSWNRSAERIYGWTRDEVIGRRIDEVIPTDPPVDVETTGQELIRTQHWTGEMLQMTRDGSQITMLCVASVITNNQNQPTGFVTVNRDVTEQRKVEQQRVELAVEQERIKILRQVISDMSHDLKNPLAAMRTSLYLLGRFADEPVKRDQYMLALDSHVLRLDSMLEDLLSLARLDHATDAFHFETVNLHDLLHETVEDHRSLAVQRQQHLELHDAVEAPPLQLDPVKFSRALSNLLINASNYTPEDGTISVSTRLEGALLHIDVSDTGIGINPEDQTRVFQRFYRADKARNSSRGGSGLGLSIAQFIVEAHGGKISLNSVPGEGSTFTVSLPLVAQHEYEADQQSSQ